MKSIVICIPAWDFQQAVINHIFSCLMFQNYPSKLIAMTPASDCARLKQVVFPEQSTCSHENQLWTVPFEHKAIWEHVLLISALIFMVPLWSSTDRQTDRQTGNCCSVPPQSPDFSSGLRTDYNLLPCKHCTAVSIRAVVLLVDIVWPALLDLNYWKLPLNLDFKSRMMCSYTLSSF